MEQLKITCRISRETAIKTGIGKYGPFERDLEPLLKLMSQEMRDWMADEFSSTSVVELDDSSASDQSIIKALEERMQWARQRAEKEQKALDDNVNELLAMPDDELVCAAYDGQTIIYRLRNCDDPRLEDLKRRLQVTVDQHNLVITEARKKYEADCEQERVAKEKADDEAQDAATASFLQWAHKMGGSISRSADEGYEIYNAVIHKIVNEFREYDEDLIVLHKGSKAWDKADWEERTPNDDAWTAFDAVTEFVKHVDKPDAVTIDVERISRFKADDELPPMTVIPVRISSALTHDVVLFFATE